jgi:solute carrier family 45 protein 1/2/4
MNRLEKILRVFRVHNAQDIDVDLINGKKSRLQLARLSLIVCGIEFCYAAETAFVSPILLKIGLPVQYMTMIWCLSPFFGFFVCPLLGAMSDRCTWKLGRRRPFMILHSIGIIFGLIFVGYGTEIGNLIAPTASSYSAMVIVVTVTGVFLLDFDCDACQSPSRAYLIDICLKEDHSVGLAMFTIMAGIQIILSVFLRVRYSPLFCLIGIGGFFGYIIGGIPWAHLFQRPPHLMSTNTSMTLFDEAHLMFNVESSDRQHIHILFTLVLVIYVLFAILTMTSYKEINLHTQQDQEAYEILRDDSDSSSIEQAYKHYPTEQFSFLTTLKQHLLTVVHVPRHLLLLCVTNFFCWSSLVCYSLYFTDFVGQEIFGNCFSNYSKCEIQGMMVLELNWADQLHSDSDV